MSFDDLGLSAEILRAVADQGYTEPTPIQREAIPAVIAGRDLLAAAQTGTGKTAGFTLPILARLQQYGNTSVSPARHQLRALILTPTRELADQVAASVKLYGKHLPLRSTVAFGGVNIDTQIPALRGGVEILVATPGRLLDHIQQKTVNLSQISILVLDEADRMLDMGFIPDIRRIIALMPKQRQTLMFSATFSAEIKKLAGEFQRDPQTIEVAQQNQASEQIEQLMYPVESARKRAVLAQILRQRSIEQVIVFSNTRHGAERLSKELVREGFGAEAIHGDKTQQQRLDTLAKFKAGDLTILVATDVAARGLDISDLPFVVNYDLPNTPEDYVHRIGRTGRAGMTGVAISLVAPEEQRQLAAIEKLLKQSIKVDTLPVLSHAPATRPMVERETPPRPAPAAAAAPVAAPTNSGSRKPTSPSPLAISPLASNQPSMPLPSLAHRRTEQIAALFLPPKYPVSRS